jgi:lipopolysaccharide transport system permease protein
VEVVAALSRSDLKVRYGRGPATLAKWLLDPFAALGVYLLMVVWVLGHSAQTPGLTLACAVVPFQLVMMSVINALRAVEMRKSIVTNMGFPRALIPLSCVVTESAGFVAALPLIPVLMALYGVEPTPALLLTPVLLAVTFALALALAYPASLVGAWAPDMAPFATSGVRTLFFLAPGLVALPDVTGTAHELLPINPLTGLFESYRSVFLEGAAPAAWELAVPLGAALAVLAVSVPLYRREQRHFAKVLA